MLPMRAIISRFLADRSGATAVEYGIIIAVLSLTIVASFESAANSLQNMLGRIADFLEASGN
jgi:pilus assembly protein Flp/PilA